MPVCEALPPPLPPPPPPHPPPTDTHTHLSLSLSVSLCLSVSIISLSVSHSLSHSLSLTLSLSLSLSHCLLSRFSQSHAHRMKLAFQHVLINATPMHPSMCVNLNWPSTVWPCESLTKATHIHNRLWPHLSQSHAHRVNWALTLVTHHSLWPRPLIIVTPTPTSVVIYKGGSTFLWKSPGMLVFP